MKQCYFSTFFGFILLTFFAGVSWADCTLCRHKQYGIEGYFDGFEAGVRFKSPYFRSCPEGWASQKTVAPRFCTAGKRETMVYGSENDTFHKCASNRSGHEVWIGGRLNDLVLIGHTRKTLQLFPVRDGGLECGADVRHAPTFTVIRHGRKDDLMYIYTPDPDGITFNSELFRIEDGVEHNIAVGVNGIVRIYGVLGDVIGLYHIADDFTITQQQLRLRQRQHYQVVNLGGDDFGINLDGADSILMRICRTKSGWSRSKIIDAVSLAPENYPPSCNVPVVNAAVTPADVEKILKDERQFFNDNGFFE